ncbi:MAG: DUF6438 domain-containing protein [Bacteroidia bacterium]|nr:DUF6438 domain-containing protein [Bacteroidia bacterium]MDW8345547.1 DUF6438 domain-containing protein [Bacteroidia bacterium]
MKLNIFIFTLLTTLLISKIYAQEVRKLKKNSLVITIEREPCRGFCPAYKMTIYGDGTVEYEGKRNVDNIGKFEKKISKSKVQELLKAFQEANYMNLENEYDDPSVADAVAVYTSIKFIDKTDGKEKTKSIKNRMRGPESLNTLQDKIDSIVGKEGFKKKS